MIDGFLELLRDYRQDSQIQSLRRRLDDLSKSRTRAAADPERNMAAAVVRLLLKKGLITADELGDEMEAIDAEQFAKIGKLSLTVGEASSPDTVNAAEIAKLDQAAADRAAEIKLDPR
jgi:hypothetical protein